MLARTPPAEQSLHLFRRCFFLPAGGRIRGSRSLHSSLLFCITLPYFHRTACSSPSRSCSRSPVLSFPRSFFRKPSSPSASEESSRPSHVRGNPANFVEFPRNELKETGAEGRERWTRFERIVTYEAREDDDGVNIYCVGLIARERAKIHSTSRTSQTSEVLTAPPIFRDNI